MKLVDNVMLLILIVGGLNYALIGFLDMNLITMLFGSLDSTGAQIVQGLVAIAALYSIKFFGYRPGGYRRNRD